MTRSYHIYIYLFIYIYIIYLWILALWKGNTLQLWGDFFSRKKTTPEHLLRTNLLRNLDTLDIKFDTLFQVGPSEKMLGGRFFWSISGFLSRIWFPIPYHPWDWYIYLHENHKKSTIHVGKYTSPMDCMGMDDFLHMETTGGEGSQI